MEPKIKELPKKLMVGKSIRMSLVENKTAELWQGFMQRRQEVKNRVDNDLYSIQRYDSINYFSVFNPKTEFTKYAMVEVSNLSEIPGDMEGMVLEGGLYAVFTHKGKPETFSRTAEFIYGKWLPNSAYELDDRPHFEILGEKYKRDSDDSEEEVWIPIKLI